MRICRRCENNGEAAKAVQLEFAPGGFSAVGGGKVNYSFMSFSAGLEIEVNNEKVSMNGARLIVEEYAPNPGEQKKLVGVKNDRDILHAPSRRT